MQTAEEQYKEIQTLFTEVFNTDAGKLVLQHLERAFNSQNHIATVSDLYQIGVRDGRRDAFYQIKKNIKGL